MKKLIQTLVLVSTLALSACIISIPRTPDGAVNVSVLLDYAQYGIDADCKFGTGALAQDVCKIGTDAITLGRDKTPSAVKVILQDAEKKQPKIAPYIDWLIALL